METVQRDVRGGKSGQIPKMRPTPTGEQRQGVHRDRHGQEVVQRDGLRRYTMRRSITRLKSVVGYSLECNRLKVFVQTYLFEYNRLKVVVVCLKVVVVHF